jgi:WD40 repeat protein/energy-coupling factor transporter ATP-binding protein EcfA2
VIAETAVRFNPFPGLRSFEPDEEHLFFGRERQIDELLARLRRTRFLAVVGTSGSGKSSLIRSGLIPSLHGGFMTRAGSSWRVAIFRPGDDPVGNLAAALATPEVLGCDPDLADLHRTLIDTTLHRSARGLAESVRLARIPAHDNVLVLVDQFEELFRFKRNPRIKDSQEEASAFVRLLLEASQQSEVPVYVVLTMRSDFIGNCTEVPGLAEAVNDGQFLVPRMSREERRAAITGPVAVGGAMISPRLVLRLLNDIGDDPDQLPILQHALMRTWDRWESDHVREEPLDLRHFEAAGTLREALSLHAEEAYRELRSEREREIAAALFKALTERGPDNRGVRRPTRLAEIGELAGASEAEVMAVVDRFRLPGRTFLMPPMGVPLTAATVLDISHESLMRIWDRLIHWVDDEGRSAQLYLGLSKAAAQYQEGNGGLWRDPELQLAVNWREEARPTALWAERYDPAFERAMLFLDHSKKVRDQYIEKRERDRRRQLRRSRLLTLTFGAAALVVLVFGLYALTLKVNADAAAEYARTQEQVAKQQEREAQRQKEKAESRKVEAERRKQEAERERNNADRSRREAEAQQQAAEAERRHAEAEGREALAQKQRAEAARGQAETAKLATEAQRAIAVQEKERADALRRQAETSETEARRLAMLQTARALAIQSGRLQQDQRQLAGLLALEAYRLHRRFDGPPEDSTQYTALRQALIQLDPARETVLRQPRDAVRALALSGDGQLLAVGGDDGAVLLFDLAHPGAAPRALAGDAEGVRALAFDPQRRALAAGGFGGSIRLWDLRRPQAAPRTVSGATAVSALAFSGSRLAAATADGRVELLDPDDLKVQDLGSPGRRVTSLAASADGSLLAAGITGGVLLWDLRQAGQPPRTLAAGQDVRALALRGDGRLLAAGTAAGTVLLWDLQGTAGVGAQPAELSGHSAAVTSLSFGGGSGGGGRLASASLDGSVRLWETGRMDTESAVLRDHSGWVWAVALSPDGRQVVSGGADRTVRLRWTRTEPYADLLCAKAARNLTAAEWSAALPGVPYEKTCPSLED